MVPSKEKTFAAFYNTAAKVVQKFELTKYFVKKNVILHAFFTKFRQDNHLMLE